MNTLAYTGHDTQYYGIEEHRLVGGKGDGMRLLQVRNGKGLEFTVSEDRCADISRLSFRGINMNYFSTCGYVAPAYYDEVGAGFQKSFTAGFLTTCGLAAAGAPCEDDGEALGLHGSIANTPAEHVWWEEKEQSLVIHAVMKDEVLFRRKLMLERTITCSLEKNEFEVSDKVTNRGDTPSPLMLMYHMNMGYPLLSEDTQIYISSSSVQARDPRAQEGIDEWDRFLPPTPNFEEQCYYHSFSEQAKAAVFNPVIDQGLVISFDPENLKCFTQWKQCGVRDYALGLEPGNCNPDGRDIVRSKGRLQILEPGESAQFHVCVSMIAGKEAWQAVKG